jgi:hypothetical protein
MVAAATLVRLLLWRATILLVGETTALGRVVVVAFNGASEFAEYDAFVLEIVLTHVALNLSVSVRTVIVAVVHAGVVVVLVLAFWTVFA